jgi:predicted nucleotidyltransferase component of viral defense system
LKSGSKKSARPPELRPWQVELLDAVAGSPLAAEITFGGATALSVIYLHHRVSDDLDFFLAREVTPKDATIVRQAARKLGFDVEVQLLPLRTSIVLGKKGKEVGHVDLAHYPYDPVGRIARWQGLRADSLLDHAVNKVQAVLTRARDRDFVDLFFLLREGPEPDIERLLSLARAKFDAGPNRMNVAERLLVALEITDLPTMLRPLRIRELQEFFENLARELTRRGPG